MLTVRSAFVLVLGLAACRNSTPAEPAPPPNARREQTPEGLPPGHPAIPPGTHPPAPAPAPTGDAHPLTWTDPPGWRRERPASAMRHAQYAIPGAGGEAQLAVFFFGVGQGGDLEENLRRWHGQFERTDAPPTREARTVGSLRVTVTAATGRFNAGAMGAGPVGPRDDWALLGAIVETPQGPWFFKLTGPRTTVAAARPAFDAMVASMRW